MNADDHLLLIPIQNADEYVSVPMKELNEDVADEIVGILAAETAPLKLWLAFAVCLLFDTVVSFLILLNFFLNNRFKR
jgi:hypothetical protein